MTADAQQILFVKRRLALGMVAVDQGSFVTSDGNVYEFELVKENYHHYRPPKDQELLQQLSNIAKENSPSRKCDESEIQKAYELAKGVDKSSDLLLLRQPVCDYGFLSLYAVIDGDFVCLLRDGDLSGAVDYDQIDQIKDIMQTSDIFVFKFLRVFDMKKIREDPHVMKYKCVLKSD